MPEQLLCSLAFIKLVDTHCYLGQRPKIDDWLSIRTSNGAKLHDGGWGSDLSYKLFQLDRMLRQSCRESIFSCHSHKTHIQVLEVDAGYKIRYDEVVEVVHLEVSKGRKI